jgi:hypothetical protein
MDFERLDGFGIEKRPMKASSVWTLYHNHKCIIIIDFRNSNLTHPNQAQSDLTQFEN